MTTTYSPDDPLYFIQWHFSLIGRLGFDTGNNTTGIERVWADYTGDGMHVGIWDTGTQAAHWDLSANYDASRHVTINGTLNDGQPISGSYGHGTSVGGLIAAADNDQGGVGVAFDANITGIRIFGGQDDINSYWSRYLQTLDHLSDFDVTNHSYGAYPSFYTWGDVAKFEASAENGRGGLGTINVKSAGNSDVDGNGCALDASRFTVTVAALSPNGQVTYYSTYGAHVLVSAPAGSVTTDMLGNGAGYDGLLDGDYTYSFGGTSAAGPVTAGVITLMLDANENLGWRDAQNILSYSAVGTGSLYTGVTTYEDSAWQWNGADNWNGGGLHFSEDYGYGMVNAFNAVRMAEIWSIVNPVAKTSANEATATTGTIATSQPINDLSTLSYSFNVAQNISLEHVAFTVNLTHSWFTDLEIRLISPDNTVMTLYDGSTGSSSTSDYGFSYTFGADGLRGEMSAGTWTVQIQDTYQSDTGILQSVSFTGYGSAVTADDVYHYTDEVLTVLAQAGQSGRQTLTDTDGGTDWIDAAAMYRDMYLDLGAGQTSTLAGTAFATLAAGTLIENAIAGDGNDLLMGNSLDNVLYGMRGNDSLDGCGGVDTACFIGNLADYEVTFADGITTVTNLSGSFGIDTLVNFEWLKFDDQTIADPSAGDPVPDETAPTLVTMSPMDDASNVNVNSNIVLTFDESVMAGDGNFVFYNGDGTVWNTITATDTDQVTFTRNTVTIDPTASLVSGSDYYVLIDATAITDRSGNSFEGIANASTFNFATAVSIIRGTNAANILYGTSGDDTIYGYGGNDWIYGQGGNDTVDSGSGDDYLFGSSGGDVLFGNSGNDRLYGEDGNDILSGGSGHDYLVGGNGDDLLYGRTGNDQLYGQDGNDILSGGSGDDYLFGGSGDDILYGGTDNDRLYGQEGNDTFDSGSGNDYLFGGSDNDILFGNSGNDQLYGEDGNDILSGGSGDDYLVGGSGDDTLYGRTGNDRLYGQDGNDTFHGDDGHDAIAGGADNDTIYGDGGNDRLYGQDGNDMLDGGSGYDYLVGGSGDDSLYGGSYNDRLYGESGNDLLDGGSGIDVMVGGIGDDTYVVDNVYDSVYEFANAGVDTVMTSLTFFRLGANIENLTYAGSSVLSALGNSLNNVMQGGDGNDAFMGMAGADTLYGGAGSDILRGGTGCDSLFGGVGADYFLFRNIADAGIGGLRDVIGDFEAGVDRIHLASIDANAAASGNQAFSYIGSDAFTGVCGQLSYVDGIISGDVDGDAAADFEIQVVSAPTLGANDFIL